MIPETTKIMVESFLARLNQARGASSMMRLATQQASTEQLLKTAKIGRPLPIPLDESLILEGDAITVLPAASRMFSAMSGDLAALLGASRLQHQGPDRSRTDFAAVHQPPVRGVRRGEAGVEG